MNVQKIQEKLLSLQNPKGKIVFPDREVNFFKPKLGKHLVRFVPNKENSEDPFINLYFHYGMGPKVMLSPISYGEKDPIVEFANTLKKSKDPEDWQLAKKLQPKARTFALVVDRSDEEKGPRYYEFGKSVYQELLALGADEEVGDFTDLTEGRDIKIEVTQGATYTETAIRPAMKSTPLSKDKKLVESWLETQPTLMDKYKQYTFDEVKGFLTKYLNPESEEEVKEPTKVENAQSNKAFEVTSPTTKAKPSEQMTDDEFDNLFKD